MSSADRNNWGRHSHPSHREYNERLTAYSRTPANDLPAFFLKAPNVHREFDLNRDPYIAKQLEDLDKTEKQRRDEQGDQGSKMVREDKPAPHHKPPPEFRRGADRQAFNKSWAREQFYAAMRNRDTEQRRDSQEHGYTHNRNQGPERSR